MPFKVSLKTKNRKDWHTLHPVILYKPQAEAYAEDCKERWPDVTDTMVLETSVMATHTFVNSRLCSLIDGTPSAVDDWIANVSEGFTEPE